MLLATVPADIFGDTDDLLDVDYAYQPIVSTSSLSVHGFEALARFPKGTPNVCDRLDAAANVSAIRSMDQSLVSGAIAKFAGFSQAGTTRLFCNVDNRSYEGDVSNAEGIVSLFRDSGLTPQNLCLEVSERGRGACSENMIGTVKLLNRLGVSIALDDFGTGMSGLHMLLLIEPDYVKIDRAFVDGISVNHRKQAIVAKLCGLAHALGFLTVAEGVEAEADFRMARDLGCDFAQGFAISHPTVRLDDLKMDYARALPVARRPGMNHRVAALVQPAQAMQLNDFLVGAADAFRADPDLRVIPVIDEANLIAGAILEEDVRRYLLSDFGPALLANKGAAPIIGGLVRRFPIADANGSVETIVNSYVTAQSSNGVILSDDGRYAGFLSNHAVLRLAAEAAVSTAREQNPLTALPGNNSILQHIEDVLAQAGSQTFVYFDFDNFKSFNDTYGFTAGDRALTMFADMLRVLPARGGSFVGHIGGDDFFLSLPFDESQSDGIILDLCSNFSRGAESLYSAADRAAGGIKSVDRFGHDRFCPLLRVSASVLHLPIARAHLTLQMVNDQLLAGKKAAKVSDSGKALVRLPESGTALLIDKLSNSKPA